MKVINLPGKKLYKIKKDGYQRRRGRPQILNIFCANCHKLFCIYQKDGPGLLLRCYLDRIAWPIKYQELSLSKQTYSDLENLFCDNCNQVIGVPMVYKKENRLAYRMREGSFEKKLRK